MTVAHRIGARTEPTRQAAICRQAPWFPLAIAMEAVAGTMAFPGMLAFLAANGVACAAVAAARQQSPQPASTPPPHTP